MSVSVKDVGEAGRGLVANKDIKYGELITSDTAVIDIPGNLLMWEAGEEIMRQVKKMNSVEKEEFYKLKRNISPEADKIEEETCIFFSNAITTDDSFRCLFPYLSVLNHSCDPNSFLTGTVNNSRQLELRAAKYIKEGEEVTVDYILVEGRFSDRPTRQAMLREGWGLSCNCSLCAGENLDIDQQKQEILKQEIVIIQADMTAECDQSPETVSWSRLCTLQSELVQLVMQLMCSQLLLVRELKSLANLAQLARKEDILENTLQSWAMIIEELGVERWRREFNMVKDKLRKWKQKRKKRENPTEEEIRQFLWLM